MTLRRSSAALALVIALCAGCASTATPTATRPNTTAVPAGTTPTTNAPSSGNVTTVRTQLAGLALDDTPHSLAGYTRALFPQWIDVDGYGCDARQEVVIEASVTPPTVHNCNVTHGRWVSAYDGATTTNPSTFDVDHVVPLANAYESGARGWTAAERTQYTNLPMDLWLVSAAANRSKGDDPPDRWRPPAHGVWCQYAERWVSIKTRWHLTATTAERDALGQMLDTCAAAGNPTPSTTAAPARSTTTPPATPTTAAAGAASVYYANCAAARATGAAPLHQGQPGYRPGLDGDYDGIACE